MSSSRVPDRETIGPRMLAGQAVRRAPRYAVGTARRPAQPDRRPGAAAGRGDREVAAPSPRRSVRVEVCDTSAAQTRAAAILGWPFSSGRAPAIAPVRSRALLAELERGDWRLPRACRSGAQRSPSTRAAEWHWRGPHRADRPPRPRRAGTLSIRPWRTDHAPGFKTVPSRTSAPAQLDSRRMR